MVNVVNMVISESIPPVTALDDAARYLYVSAVSYRYAEVESRKNWNQKRHPNISM